MVATVGKKVFKPGTHIIQVMVDDHSVAGAAERLKRVRAIALQHGARELAPSLPRATRGTPFIDFDVCKRCTTLRNVPTNGLFSHSRAAAALAAKLPADQHFAVGIDSVDLKYVLRQINTDGHNFPLHGSIPRRGSTTTSFHSPACTGGVHSIRSVVPADARRTIVGTANDDSIRVDRSYCCVSLFHGYTLWARSCVCQQTAQGLYAPINVVGLFCLARPRHCRPSLRDGNVSNHLRCRTCDPQRDTKFVAIGTPVSALAFFCV